VDSLTACGVALDIRFAVSNILVCKELQQFARTDGHFADCIDGYVYGRSDGKY
jgi:hypothetical protein